MVGFYIIGGICSPDRLMRYVALSEQGSPESLSQRQFQSIGKGHWAWGGEPHLWLYSWIFAVRANGSHPWSFSGLPVALGHHPKLLI